MVDHLGHSWMVSQRRTKIIHEDKVHNVYFDMRARRWRRAVAQGVRDPTLQCLFSCVTALQPTDDNAWILEERTPRACFALGELRALSTAVVRTRYIVQLLQVVAC